MARLVAAFGSSHSIMLVCQRADWQGKFREADARNRALYDHAGNKTDYASLLATAPADAAGRVTDALMGERFDRTSAAMTELQRRIEAARLDVLIVVGDDQAELFRTTNNPAFAIYFGATIRNAAAQHKPDDTWYTKARLWRQEDGTPRDYPVRADMAKWLIGQLCERDFDITAMDGLEDGQFEGHAFSFIHKRYLQNLAVPIIPVIVNTFDPPNQPTPRRCVALGAALRELIAAYPEDLRVGVLASGGLSHFVVDEELDRKVLTACEQRDAATLRSLPRGALNSGSSEILNWVLAAGALEGLSVRVNRYTPIHRTPAGTGVGAGFLIWS